MEYKMRKSVLEEHLSIISKSVSYTGASYTAARGRNTRSDEQASVPRINVT